MSPSIWKEEHFVIVSLTGWGLLFYGSYKLFTGGKKEEVHNTNKMDKPYKLRLNKFADMTNHEFKSIYAGSKVNHHRMFRGTPRGSVTFMYEKVRDVPASVDWREKGDVTAVMDQGQCVEGINQIKTNKLVSLSEQELVDCDNQENQRCNGGLMEYAFEYIKQKGGLTIESYYPYTENDGSCDASKKNSPAVSIDGHETVPANDEDALLKAVANQPVSVAIDAGGSDFQFYSEDFCCCSICELKKVFTKCSQDGFPVGEKQVLDSELWHACAGPLVSLPVVGSRVVYFPQGIQ